MEEALNTTDNLQQKYIDIFELFRILKDRRKVFYWVLPITFVVSSALILCVPRYYTCEVKLAPEAQEVGSSGTLQSLASTFGFNMQSISSSDALRPNLYPDIISSPDFLVNLFDVPVNTMDSTFIGTYYQYLLTHTKNAFWKRWKTKIILWLSPKESEPIIGKGKESGTNVFCLSKPQWTAIEMMNSNISCSIDKKTDVIILNVTAQDKIVCAIMADSVCAELQSFITNYRTAKSRIDLKYYEGVMQEAYAEYQRASDQYIKYIDSHSGINQEKYRIEAKNLETEMDIKQTAYTSFQKQYLATQARLQENTPAFTVLQSSSIPLRPAGPKRMIFVLGMLILSSGVTCCILWKEQLRAVFM